MFNEQATSNDATGSELILGGATEGVPRRWRVSFPVL
jgi:hypothetical protein